MKTARLKSKGGRPSKAQAEKLEAHLLDIATELFLGNGYGAASIEAIAARAGISKRTFYHRYADKAALFNEVVHRLIGHMRPPENLDVFDNGSLEEILTRLAKLMLQAALSPQALALHRIIIAESKRFPELLQVVQSEGTRSYAVKGIAKLLAHQTNTRHPEFAAEQFMQLIISVPQRRAIGLGASMSDAELEDWIQNSIDLILHGCG